ncbi:MAG: protein kinase [Hydrogenophaga sp.]|uniref:protein kinase domain-containing protein n=1 Tax=Hydrogenophaga sp. TaxID=1904254 RepID=UPI0026145220|nr:protein kinase [Hydrogenophaga sp.]MCW5672920.1 protein kinase [Hydrogenophaga sp.]
MDCNARVAAARVAAEAVRQAAEQVGRAAEVGELVNLAQLELVPCQLLMVNACAIVSTFEQWYSGARALTATAEQCSMVTHLSLVLEGVAMLLRQVNARDANGQDQPLLLFEGQLRLVCGQLLNCVGDHLESELFSVSPVGQPEWEIDFGAIQFMVDRNGLLTLIGRGGFGAVYASSYRGYVVATKAPQPNARRPLSAAMRTRIAAMFAAEAAIGFPLVHPNIVRTFGGALHDDVPYLVTELIDGWSLYNALHELPAEAMDEQRLWQIAADIARGLTYLHTFRPQAIVHRDIKPANIMLTRGGQAKLIDFGLACKKDHGADCPPSFAGTTRYMAPEVARREPFNEASDIYSFGVTVVEMWTRRKPWGHKSPEATQAMVVSNALPPELDELPADGDPRIVAMSCLEISPRDRLAAVVLAARCELAAARAQPDIELSHVADPDPRHDALSLRVPASPLPALPC